MITIAYGSGSTPIARPRLENLIDRIPAQAITLIWGPPGSGKHSLLEAFWGRTPLPVQIAHLQTDAARNPVDNLCRFESINSPDPGPFLQLSEFVEQWRLSPHDGILVLDGGRLSPGQWKSSVPHDLLLRLPAGMRLVLVARSRPRLALERHHLAGTLLEIGPDALRLSRNETAQLLSATGISSLPPGSLDTIHKTTRGWIAGVQLCSLHVRSSHHPELAHQDFGENQHLQEYLEQELLDGLPPRGRALLFDLSILNSPSNDLCDAVLERSDSAVALQELADSFPLLELDPQRRWSLHPLVRLGLAAQLRRKSPERHQALHRRAARWSLVYGQAEETVRHALEARDAQTLECVAERALENLFRNSDFHALQQHARDLPPELAHDRPFLSLFLAWALFHTGREKEGVLHLDRSRRLALESGMEHSAPDRFEAIISHEAFLRSILLRLDDRLETSLAVAARGLASGLHTRPFLATSFQAQIAIGQFLSCDLDAARQALEATLAKAEPSGHHLAYFGAGYTLSEILSLQGRTEHAHRLIASQRERSGSGSQKDMPVSGYLEIACSRLHLLEGNLPEAAIHAEKGILLGRRCDNIRILNYGLAARAEIAALSGDLDGAARALDEAEAISRRTRMHWAIDYDDLEAKRMRLLLPRLPGTTLHAWLARTLPGLETPSLLRWDATRTALRLLTCLGRGQEAVTMGARWQDFLERENLDLPLLELHYALALACEHLGRESQAVSHFDRALRLCDRLGMPGPFYHGPELDGIRRDVIAAWQNNVRHATPAARALARRLGGKLTDSVNSGSVLLPASCQALSEREREVLRAIRDGKSNKEIADALFVAESTIKSHLKNIFAKLDVPNRTRAVSLASDAGIL